MEKWFLPFVGAAILIYLIIQIATAKKRREAKLLAKVRAQYGKTPDRDYTEEELQKIRTWFDLTHQPDAFSVDDITWNDLNLDAIFAAMNHTYSSAGEEVLYALVREPVFEETELLERERLITFFQENSEAREKLSVRYAAVGRTRRFSVIRFVQEFEQVQTDSNFRSYLCIALLIAAVLLAFFVPAAGIFAAIAVMMINVFTYYAKKGKIEPYYVSLAAVSYLIDAASHIAEEKIPEIQAYTDELRTTTAELKRVKKDMAWLGTGTNIGSSMDLIQVFADYFRMITHIDFIKFNRIVKLISTQKEEIRNMIRILGYIESMISVASYRETLPLWCRAEFDTDHQGKILLKNGYHPLVHREPVANSIEEAKPVLLTGSNASGKSTFLRMVGVNALLAQSVHTVHAERYRAPFFRIYSSMALKDSIQSGESYYIVEIKSIKRILDQIEGAYPVLCFVDEVLRGTNTVERIAASSQILKTFAEKGAFIFAATHDIELTQLLEGIYANYHFEEEIRDGQVLFNYQLKEGKATTRNAIRLLSVMGYDPEVIRAAEETAGRFLEEGVWQLS